MKWIVLDMGLDVEIKSLFSIKTPNTDGFRIGYSIDTKFGSYERNSGGKREGWHWLRWGQSNWRKIAKGSYRVDSLMTHRTQSKIC